MFLILLTKSFIVTLNPDPMLKVSPAIFLFELITLTNPWIVSFIKFKSLEAYRFPNLSFF